MRIRPGSAAACLLLGLAAGCSDQGILAPSEPGRPRFNTTAALPDVRLSEIHYDNTGTDAGESIELSGPADFSLEGWKLVLYNGSNGLVYNIRALGGSFENSCEGRGVLVFEYPSNGIQNGNPDAIALVNPADFVVEFLSYGGTFTAMDGPALGLLSVDIGASQTGGAPLGQSLQRSSADTWAAGTSTFGTCNDDGPPPVEVDSVVVSPPSATLVVGGSGTFSAVALDQAQQIVPNVLFTWSSTEPSVATVSAAGVVTAVAVGSARIVATAPNGEADSAEVEVVQSLPLPATRFSELHYDNFGTDAGESIEIEGDAGVFLAGWKVVLYNGSDGTAYNTTTFSGFIPNHCEGRGVLVLNYATDGIQNGPDGMALVDGTGAVVEFLSYEGSFTATDGPAAGLTSTDIGVFQNSAPAGQSLQRLPNGVWVSGGSTFGACNPDEPPPPPRTISFTGRTPTDPALPVGFEDQLFATLHEGPLTVPTTFTWSSETPAIASIDQNGVMRALAEGTATFRATALDGTTAIFSLPTRVALASTTAIYEGNAEFGEPADADPADDFILRHVQFTSSYNPIRGIPNWVSYNLEATHFGLEDRCDCFTFDPALPAGFTRYTTADYTGAGAFHGYSIDRGHLARSFDRTSAGLDNAFTFYFSNIIPQAADNNQGPWAVLENVLGDFARLQNREVYIIAGASGSKGTVKDEGKITIPAQVWKVALLLPRDQGLEDVDDLGDVELVAVIMPNDPGVRDVPWETYQTTVDAIEALSGYDLLALLPDQIEIALESGNRPPVAVTDGPYSSSEGAAVTLSAAGSTDPDEDALTYAWDFGDGTTGSGVSPSHVWSQDGSYVVTLTVTDAVGLISSVSTTATVSNVAPDIAAFAGAILLPWETYSRSGSFTDPGADSWSATVNYGDGSGQNPLALNGKSFTLSHVYQQPGGFTVSVRVSDDDVSTLRTAVVTVWTHAEGIRQSKLLVDQWIASGVISYGNGNALLSKLDAALKLREEGKVEPSIDHLEEVLGVLRDYIREGRITAANAEPLRVLVNRLITSMSH